MKTINQIRFACRKEKFIRPLDWILLPSISVGVMKCGKFKFYRLTFFWFRRGIQFSIGKGPYTIVQAELKNIYDAMADET